MRYLTTHDIAFINSLVTGKIQPPNYITLESAMAAQYSYGPGDEIANRASILLRRLVTTPSFVSGNSRTALIATLSFLSANGYKITVTDEEVVGAIQSFTSQKISAIEAVRQLGLEADQALSIPVGLRELIKNECIQHSSAIQNLIS